MSNSAEQDIEVVPDGWHREYNTTFDRPSRRVIERDDKAVLIRGAVRGSGDPDGGYVVFTNDTGHVASCESFDEALEIGNAHRAES